MQSMDNFPGYIAEFNIIVEACPLASATDVKSKVHNLGINYSTIPKSNAIYEQNDHTKMQRYL